MFGSPLTLQIFIDSHVRAEDTVGTNETRLEIRNRLIKEGMVRLREDIEQFGTETNFNKYTLTDKGIFMMEYLMQMPFPEERKTYVIPHPAN